MNTYKLTSTGSELAGKWEALREKVDTNNLGWSLTIEDEKYVKTLEDVCGLLLQGYDADVINVLNDWKEDDSESKYFGFTLDVIISEMKNKYITGEAA